MSAQDAPLQRLTFDNPWIAAVDGTRRPLSVWWVLAAGLASAAMVGVLARILAPLIPQAVAARLPGVFGPQLGLCLLYVLVFLPLWLVAGLGGLAERRNVWRSERRPALAGTAGALLALVGLGLAVALTAAAGAVVPGLNAAETGGAAGVLLGMLVFAYQAGAEEMLFRGWMQPVLCARLGPWVGLVIAAAAFGVLHLVGAPHQPLAIVNLMLGGLMFGLLALRSGGLWAAFCAHTAWNWAEACVLGLEPNPGVGPFGALADLDLAGAPLWSGGDDALNGSLALTITLAAIVVGLVCVKAAKP